ncbi:MAG: TetR/AcrR family transcriptional regulator [Bacteroidetes bacterium]|nr:TetR/AcrR family transcriptional regulator [Bacteroidota bacterium]
MADTKHIWLATAHAEFARKGENALKIDTLAKAVGKSRSSFYNLFGDMEGFRDELIKYALEVTRNFAAEANVMERFFPDYGEVVIKYKDMLFFNKHIFLGRHKNKTYADTWELISKITENKTEELWMKMINLESLPPHQREKFYETIRTAAFMRLQYDEYTYERMYNNVIEINRSFGFLMND